MAKPSTRAEFKTYCLRRLGDPVITINVDDDQVEDRIDDALSFWYDYHYDGTEKVFLKHKLTQTDITRKWIYCPDSIIGVVNLMPIDDSSASTNMFDLRYQMRLNDLYDFSSVSYTTYEISLQHIQTLQMLFSGAPQYRFNRHQNKLFLDIDWAHDVVVDDYLIFECYRKLSPDVITITGTLTGNTNTGNVMTGTSTVFDSELLELDFITLSDGQEVQIKQINSPTSIVLTSALSSNVTNVTMSKEAYSDIWDDRFLKQYATAKIKYQWGSNLSKFAGIQMPGGVTFDGPRIMQEAQVEIDKLEEEMQSYNVLPDNMFVG